ncbi:MAG: hypothetical protein AB7S53_04715 [Thiomonas sp.]
MSIFQKNVIDQRVVKKYASSKKASQAVYRRRAVILSMPWPISARECRQQSKGEKQRDRDKIPHRSIYFHYIFIMAAHYGKKIERRGGLKSEVQLKKMGSGLILTPNLTSAFGRGDESVMKSEFLNIH